MAKPLKIRFKFNHKKKRYRTFVHLVQSSFVLDQFKFSLKHQMKKKKKHNKIINYMDYRDYLSFSYSFLFFKKCVNSLVLFWLRCTYHFFFKKTKIATTATAKIRKHSTTNNWIYARFSTVSLNEDSESKNVCFESFCYFVFGFLFQENIFLIFRAKILCMIHGNVLMC